MKRDYKNILIIISIGIVLIVSMFFVFNKKEEYKELPKVKLKDSINNNGLAIMVESDYKTEQYTQWEDKEFPTNGYTLNRIKSGCLDKNGKDIDALIYNEDNKTISIKTKQSVYCYLYYDNLFKGKGTEQEPYEINYIEDLVRLANSVNKDSNTYNSKHFILKRNLDFNTNDSYMKYNDTGFGDINGVSGVEGIKDELTNPEGSGFIPIGFEKFFEGNIDGKNNKISNLWIYNKTYVNKMISFISRLSNGSISNLTISGEIKTDVNTPLGGLVNRIENSTIDNCTNEINVTSNNGSYAIGGLVAWSSGSATIKNSTNKGNITNGGQTGGIIANHRGGTLTIENCKNYGKIENNLGTYIGAIVGQATDTKAVKTIIKNSANYGDLNVIKTLNSSTIVGGIIGQSGKELEITNSHNEGNIFSIEDNDLNSGSVNGGIIGELIVQNENNKILTILKDTYNSGNITGGTRIGGLIGRLGSYNSVIIDKCYNLGKIASKKSNVYGTLVGGIVGSDWKSSNTIILNSYNKEDIEALPEINTGRAGGLVGGPNVGTGTDEGYVKIINSYNMGNVTGTTRDNATGLSSDGPIYDSLRMNNVYNVGNVTSTDNLTPNYAIGRLGNDSYIINNTYYKNTLVGSNITNEGGTAMEESAMKNQTFADLLNSNLASIDLKTIDSLLDGYTLVNWKIDPTSGYPTLDYNLE